MRISLLILLTATTANFLSAADATWAQVQTVLEARCTDCHGEKKQKAGLRLDSPEWLEKGSKEGPVVVAGKPELSKLYTMAALPEDHDDRMPPKGARLTAEQLELIKTWIAAGAKTAAIEDQKAPLMHPDAPESTEPTMAGMSSPDVKKNDLDHPQSEHPKPEVAQTPAGNPADDQMGANHEVTAALTKSKTTAIIQPTAEPIIPAPVAPQFALTALTSQQFVITTLPGGWLEVNAGHTKKGLTDAHIPLLAKIGPAVAFLDLANSGVTDRQLKMLSEFTNLQRLHLEHTPITDAGLTAVAACQQLTYLNLFTTEISDAGLASLKSLKQLDELYVWQSKVTKSGIAALKKAMPELTIISGPDELPTVKLDAKKKKKK